MVFGPQAGGGTLRAKVTGELGSSPGSFSPTLRLIAEIVRNNP
jgi:hypothetical protein